MKTKQLHYISGITIMLFIAMHLSNHFLSIFGINLHIAVMKSLRIFYRNIFIESILLIAVFTQIISGIKLAARKRRLPMTAFERLQIWTGLYLAGFLIVHVSAIFWGRLYLHLDTNFYFGAAGINTFPFNLFYVPYYLLAIISFFGHLAALHHSKMKTAVLGISPKTQSKLLLIFGAVLSVFIFYGLTNHFNGVTIPEEYKVVVGQ